jgi:hypothetical protein
MNPPSVTANHIGYSLAVTGSALSIIGTLVNNLWLDHIFAMWIWLFSNPILYIWSIGVIKHRWHNGLSMAAIATMYLVFFVTNVIGLLSLYHYIT